MIFDVHSPFKPVNWRWEMARWLSMPEGKHLRGFKGDEYVLLAKKFQAKLDKVRNERERAELAYKLPGIHHALEIYQTESQDDRYTIEARILANESRERIAFRQNTTPEVVFWYEKLFFDVRESLHRKDWICNRVLGPAAHRGIRARQYDLLLKLYALVGGPLIVDALVELNSRRGRSPQTADEVDVFWGEDHRDSVRRHAAISARCLPLDPQMQVAILEAHHRLLEMEQAAMASGSDQSRLIVANLSATLQAIPFQMSSEANFPGAGKFLSYEANNGAELRAGELLQDSLQDSAPPDLSVYKFPERSHV